jgi:predicted DNA-binding protein
VLHLWYTSTGMKSTTSSFRISTELVRRLEQATRKTKRGKNAIIIQALQEYLDRHDRSRFLEEARRQSLLASSIPDEHQDVWLNNADVRGWK